MNLKNKLNFLKMNIFIHQLINVPEDIISNLMLVKNSDINYAIILQKLNFNTYNTIDNLDKITEISDEIINNITKYSSYFPTGDEISCFKTYALSKFFKSQGTQDFFENYEQQFLNILQLDFEKNSAAWFLQHSIFYGVMENFNWNNENSLNIIQNFLEKAETDLEEYKEYYSSILRYIGKEEI